MSLKLTVMRRFAAGFIIAFLFACAGARLDRLAEKEELPPELSKELQEKFKVMEAPAPESAPTPTPTASPSAETLSVAKKPQKAELKKIKQEERKKAQEEAKKRKLLAKLYPNRRPKTDPIWVGEKMTFDITWLGVSAGEFTLETLPFKYIDQRKVYHIQGRAKSSSVFSIFYRLDDMIESFLDFDSLFTHRFHMSLNETKQTRDSLELHDVEKGKIFYWNRHNRVNRDPVETKEFFDRTPLSQDTLSTLYYVRTLPLPDKGVVKMPIATEGKTWEGEIHVVRREEINTAAGRFKAVVIRPETKFQGVLKKTGDSHIWLSDDDRRWVLRLEAKVKIGAVLAEIKRIKPGEKPEE